MKHKPSKEAALPPTGPVVLDSSAVLAFLTRETGRDVVAPMLSGGYLSTVNYAEVIERLASLDVLPDAAAQLVGQLEMQIVDLGMQQASLAASLRQPTRSIGLSLGDRACVALAMMKGTTVVTADRAWDNAAVPAKIFLIR